MKRVRVRALGAGLLVAGLVALSPGHGAPVDSPYLAQLQLGLTAAEQSRWEAASREFQQAAQLDPDDPLAYAGLALCRLAWREDDAAAALFRRAAVTGRAEALAQYGLGLCYFDVGQLATAETHLQQAAKHDALLFGPPFYRAVIALIERRLNDAGDLLAQAEELGAPTLPLRYLEALRLVAAARWEAARDALRQLQPKLTTATPGLPLSLPLEVAGQPGSEVRFSVPVGSPLSERIAPAAVGQSVAVSPASDGALTIDYPLPGDVVTGRIPIRISLLGARSFRYVSVSVDGRLKGMTNREPYYVMWDTGPEAEGQHEIRVRAQGDTDLEVSFTVEVRRGGAAEAGAGNPYEPAAYRTLSRRFSTLLLHSLPPISIEKLLFEAWQQQDPDLAIDMYERMLARDGTRVDLIPPLMALYRAQGLAYEPETIPEPKHGVPGAMRVALTFDDGPRPDFTPAILQSLARYRARATFLVTGRMSERYPELVRAIVDGGHELAQHTWDHPRLDTVSDSRIVWELVKTKVMLDDLVGGSSRFFRPPGGHYNASIRQVVASLGYFPIFWTVNCGSFVRLSPLEGALAVSRRTEDGGILLLHNGADNTLPMLPHLLDELSRRGFRFVTVTDILRAPVEGGYVSGPRLGPLNPNELQNYAGHE